MNEKDFDKMIKERINREDVKIPSLITNKIEQSLYTLPTMKQRARRLILAILLSVIAFITLAILALNSPLL